jgi:hypothetical protein
MQSKVSPLSFCLFQFCPLDNLNFEIYFGCKELIVATWVCRGCKFSCCEIAKEITFSWSHG